MPSLFELVGLVSVWKEKGERRKEKKRSRFFFFFFFLSLLVESN
jgi:hypothetical protein